MEEQTQSAPTLCRLGCGFFGTSATEGMCSKCFRDYQLRKQQQAATSSPSSATATTSAANQQHNDSLNQSSSSASLQSSEAVEERDFSEACVRMMGGGIQATPLSDLPASSQATPTLEEKGTSPAPGDASPGATAKSPKKNRCALCRKKVGLTGFYCRCGEQFCSLHRYADKHNCSFDYKTSGREELQRKHPKVVASKVQKL